MIEQITYFEESGEINTEDVFKLAMERAAARGISKIVLASTSGNTAKKAMETLEGSNIQMVVVPWQYGFMGGDQPFPEDLVGELEGKGHQVYFGTMLFHTDKFYGSKAPEALANMLRMFSQGTKVCVEILLMATNGGKIKQGEKVVTIAGTMSGADTALVCTAATTAKLSKARINEIICKPL